MIFDHRHVRFTPHMDWVLRQIRPNQEPIHTILNFDKETFLIQPARTVPQAVCMSMLPCVAQIGPTPSTIYEPTLLHANFDRSLFYETGKAMLLDRRTLLTGANVSFDLLVLANEFPDLLPLVFEALEQNRVICIEVAQRLIDIATNQLDGRYGADGVKIKYKYSLAALAKRYFNLDMDKDTWRLRYGTLWNVPLQQWEQGAIDYSLGDSVINGGVLQGQLDPLSFGFNIPDSALRTHMTTPERVGAELTLLDVFRQTRAQFWIALMVARGFRVDPFNVRRLKELLEMELDAVRTRLVAAGLVRKGGERDTKAAKARMEYVCAAQRREVKRTPSQEVALDEEACTDSGDSLLADYASYTSIAGMIAKDVGALEDAAEVGMPIQSRFETLVHSGRMSSSGSKLKPGQSRTTYTYQLHNVRKKLGIDSIEKLDKNIDKKIGVRQCFVPRPGFYLGSLDYSMFELHSWAQVSVYLGVPLVKLIDALNAGRDVHIELGARLLGISYEEAWARRKEPEVKDARQASKPGNFGYPGGLGWKGFMGFAKSNYSMIFTAARAKEIKAAWTAQWEPKPYFDVISSIVGQADLGEIIHPISMRRRAWVSYTEGANGFFQALAGDAKKAAGWALTKEMFLDQGSPLFGSRIVNDVHDEFLFEFPCDIAHEAAHRAADVMMLEAKKWMPDCPPRVEPALMVEWAKDAEAVYLPNKRLTVWRPPVEG